MNVRQLLEVVQTGFRKPHSNPSKVWQYKNCSICSAPIPYPSTETIVDSPDHCLECGTKYPGVLRKACEDEFDYALGLRGGTTLRFSRAEIHGDGVTLHDVRGLPYPCPRGVQVLLSDIVWLADAPIGS